MSGAGAGRGRKSSHGSGSASSGRKPKAASYADFSRMNQASSAVAGIIDVLRSQLATLEQGTCMSRGVCVC